MAEDASTPKRKREEQPQQEKRPRSERTPSEDKTFNIYKERILSCIDTDYRVKDNLIELITQRILVNTMKTITKKRKKTEQSDFSPIAIIAPLALECVLNRHDAFIAEHPDRSDDNPEWQTHMADLGTKTRLVRFYPRKPGDDPERMFPHGSARRVRDAKKNRKWLVSPHYDFIVAPLFNRQASHWSLLVFYIKCARIMYDPIYKPAASSFFVHYDTIPGTNCVLAGKLTRLFADMGYYTSRPVKYTEAYAFDQQLGNWECGYSVIILVQVLCDKYKEYHQKKRDKNRYTPMLLNFESNIKQDNFIAARKRIMKLLLWEIQKEQLDPVEDITVNRKILEEFWFGKECTEE